VTLLNSIDFSDLRKVKKGEDEEEGREEELSDEPKEI
jgi:hypothetical protein